MNGADPSPEHESHVEHAAAARSRRRWWIHLLVIGAYPVILGVLGASRYSEKGPALTHNSKGLVITCLFQLASFGIIFGLGWLASRASRDDLLLRWRLGFWTVPLGVVYSVGLRLGVGLAAMVVFSILVATGTVSFDRAQSFAQANRPDVSALVDVSAMRNDPLYFWLTLTFVSFVVAGFREELWRSACLAGLRRLWPGSFGSKPGQVAAAAVASIVFGLGHQALGPLGVASATLLGFGLGLIMVLHQSIWPAVIAHGMFDATTFALLPWAMEQIQRGA
jgi:membrane protease YdiL (CAAX protease family)